MTSLTEGPFLYGPRERVAQAYWESQLADLTDPGTLPTSRARSTVVVTDQPSIDYAMPAAMSAATRSLTGGSPLLTLAVVASGVFTCLRRYGAKDRIALGTPARDTAQPQLLPIVVAPQRHTSFRELLSTVRDRLSEGYSHEGFPIERLRQDDSDASPGKRLFHVRVELSGHAGDVPPSGDDVTLRIAMDDGGIGGSVHYNDRLFDEDTVRRFTGHLNMVLAAGLAAPATPVDDLDILTDEERNLIATLVAPHSAHPDPRGVHDLVFAQAARTPDATAIVDGDVSLSYRTMCESAERIAAKLAAKGVGAGDVVGLHAQRSRDAIVGALGILRSGAAYLPLDPDLARGRLNTMIESAGARVVLSATGGVTLGTTELLDLSTATAPATPPPATAITPESPAYVMFTSGSTGTPKGIEMPHRALVNLLNWQHAQSNEVGAAGRTLLRTPLWFDVSFQEIFATLGFGGTAVVAEPGAERDPAAVVRLLDDHRIQRVFLPFVALQQLGAEASRRKVRLTDLREVVTAGEQLKISPPLVEFFRGHPTCTLRNQYGPTETHVVTSYTLRGRPTRWPELPPIGEPIDGAAVHVLDESMRPVPVGVTGQLAVSGVPVANGYRGDPMSTKDSFVTGHRELADRLYLTGDLARRRADGNIEFRGRADRQLKIRGHRVEPGEVETALMLHHTVEQAVVVGRVADDGHTHLAAYVVATSALKSESELRDHLGGLLPSYQIPRTITVVPDLPLTATGKVDTEALPEPGQPGHDETRPTSPPRTEVETALADIWRQVLRIDQVGIFDHFLELGGDSIVATQAVAAANDLGLNITMKDFFAHPTIAELAAIVPEHPRPRAERADDERAAPLTPVQKWFTELSLPSPDYWNISVLLRAADRLDRGRVERALHDLVARHEALRTPYTGGDHMSGPLPPHVVVRTTETVLPAGADLEPFVTEAARRAHREVRLAEGPLVVAVVIRAGEGEADRLLIVVHHMVVDVVSWRILLDEFQTIYRALTASETPRLPRRTSSYQTWANELVKYATSPAAESELAHWAAIPVHPVRPLPSKRPGPGTESTSRRIEVAFTAEQSGLLLRDLPAKYHARIEEILVAGLFDAIRQWTGEPTLLMEFEGHGRGAILPDIDVTRTVGWFSTMYPLELHVPGSAEVLGAVKEAMRAVPNRGIGYGILRYLSPSSAARQLAGKPRPQVKFNYLGQFDAQFGSTSLFTPADEPIGPMVAPDSERPVPLYVQGHLVDGQLRFFLEYSDECQDEAEMRLVIERFKEYVVRLVDQRDLLEDGALTPSDFPATTLNDSDLHTLLRQLES